MNDLIKSQNFNLAILLSLNKFRGYLLRNINDTFVVYFNQLWVTVRTRKLVKIFINHHSSQNNHKYTQVNFESPKATFAQVRRKS